MARLVDDQLRELADGMIIKASNAAIGKFEGAMRRDDNGFALRYRAQRIVFDCLSENVERITSSETGIATIGEIKQKIEKTSPDRVRELARASVRHASPRAQSAGADAAARDLVGVRARRTIRPCTAGRAGTF